MGVPGKTGNSDIFFWWEIVRQSTVIESRAMVQVVSLAVCFNRIWQAKMSNSVVLSQLSLY